MSTHYPLLNNRPIDQWKVVELKEELRRRKIPAKGLKEELVKRLDEAIHEEMELRNQGDVNIASDPYPDPKVIHNEEEAEQKAEDEIESIGYKSKKTVSDAIMVGTDDFSADVDEVVKVEADVDEVVKVEADVEEGIKVEDVPTKGDDNMDGKIEGKCVNAVLIENMDIGSESVHTQFEYETDSRFDEKHEGKKAPGKDETPSMVDSNDSTVYVNEGVKVEDMTTMDEASLDGKVVRTDEDTMYANEGVKLEDMDKMDGTSLDGKVLEEAVNTISKENRDSGTERVIEQFESSNSDLKLDEKHKEQQPPVEDAMLSPVERNNQVPEVSSDLGFQVKCESYSDSVSINEKNILKDNLNANNFHLELEVVNQEMVQPSSVNVPLIVDALHLHQLEDGKELGMDHVSLEEIDAKYATNMELCKKEVDVDGGSPDKLDLDIGENVSECKHIESSSKSDDLGERKELCKVNVLEDGNQVDPSSGSLGREKMDIVADEEVVPAAPVQKRKLEGNEVRITEGSKRQRRWNTETIKVHELKSSNISSSSSTPKDSFQTTVKHIFARSDSTLSVDSSKERIVPPSTKTATNSLRIDRFLRPFTLKAVQDLLARTGSVCNFWMDHIKTHCYVTYLSVEEATATRDAVYNLQWPPNGGRLLIADFVDPQEVKARAEAPLQSPGPVSPAPTTPISPPFQQQKPGPPAARPQQQSLRQKLPPPPLSDPPPAVLRQPLPPPPPPPAKKPEPAVLTLDDLFKRTTATPRISYLPLSEEQVVTNIAARGNKSSRE